MKRLPVYLFVFLFILAFVDASLAQFQMMIFNRVIVPEYVAKIGVFLILGVHWMISPKQRMNKKMHLAWIILAMALAASFFVVRARGAITFGEQLTNLFVNYLYMLSLPLCFLCSRPLLRLSFLFRILVLLLVPLCLLGIAQYVLSDPLVATSASDGSFLIVAWMYQSRVRAFSLFASGFSFSCYLAIMMSYCVAFLTGHGYSSKTRSFALAGCGLIAVATFATITRLGFLFVLMAALVAVIMGRRRTYSRLLWGLLPLIGLLVAVLAVTLGPLISSSANSDLASDITLVDRLLNWAIALNTWTNSGTMIFLLGNGLSQGSGSDYVVDNTFLNFAVQAGTIGLTASVLFMYSIWMSFRKIINRDHSPAVIAICAFWATWILTGMIDWTNAIYALVAVPLLLSSEYNVIGLKRQPEAISEM